MTQHMAAPTRFPSFPVDARLWVYAATASLTAGDVAHIQRHVGRFIQDWSSHGRPVRGALHVEERRFVMLAATVDDGDLSGCGIDASVQAVEAAAEARSIAWIPALHVIYRDAEGRIQHCTRPQFRTLADAGRVTADTPVFDPSITSLQALRSGQFEQPAGSSWHAQAFDLRQPA